MRVRFFKWVAKISYKKYWLLLLICILFTIVMGVFSSKIRIETTWMSMLPEGEPSVVTFKNILDEFGAVTQIVVALEGPDKERIIQVAQEIAPGIADVKMKVKLSDEYKILPVVKRVDFAYDTNFVANHGLMLQKAKNLEKMKILFTDYNLVPFMTHINDVFETEYVSDSDNLIRQEKRAVQNLDGMFQFIETISEFATGEKSDVGTVQKGINAVTIGDGYYLSNDKKMLLILVTPTMSIDDITLVTVGVESMDARLKEFNREYPDVHIGMTGMHVITRDEMVTGMSDTIRNVTFAIILILAVFILSFRMWSGPIIAMIVLISGIIWDIGLAQIVYGRLNIFTAFCSIILIGLGVDYAIHIISAYTELRHKGRDVEQALSESFTKVGMGLVTGAFTTAVAFLVLMLTSFSAFREFGFVVGMGIISCLTASIFFLPAVLVLKEKIRMRIVKTESVKMVNMEFHFLGELAKITRKNPCISLSIVLLITAFLIYEIGNLRMNENYMELEAEGLESVRLQDEIVENFSLSPDNMMTIGNSIEEVSEIADRLNERPTVGLVESIADFLPSRLKQEKREPIIMEIREAQKKIPPYNRINTSELVTQLQRFNYNIIEISNMAYISGLDRVFNKCNLFLGLDEDGNQIGINKIETLIKIIKTTPESYQRLNNYQKIFRKNMRSRIEKMANPEPITLNMVPKKYVERFISKDGNKFLIVIYSSKNIWEGLFTNPFLTTMLRDVPNATGTPIFMKEMVRIAGEQGKFAFILSFVVIFLLLLMDFKSIKTALGAMVPLLLSVIWLFGIMGFFGIELTIVNVIGLPLILGIGIDDGVHIVHRCKIEGKERLPYAVSSIGRAIFLTTLTTMLGFGSLIPSVYRGYTSLGILITIGIGLCFFTSVVILPAVINIIWSEKRMS